MRKTLFILFYFSFIWAHAQQGSELMKVTDLLKIRQVNSVALSNDGQQLVYGVTDIIADPEKKEEDEYTFVSQLYWMDGEGKQPPRQLTYAAEGASQPAWSPDGKQLAFVRRAEGKPQIFLLSLAGGEPMQLTSFPYGASNPQWSPDGKQLLFTSGISLRELLADTTLNPDRLLPEWSYEKPGFFDNRHLATAEPARADPNGSLAEIRAYLDKNEKDNKAKVINQLQFQEEARVSPTITFSHVFLVDARAGATPRDLTPGFSSARNPSFTPDGRLIIFEGDLHADQHPSRSLETAIYRIAVDGGDRQLLVGKAGVSYSGSALSPSGKWLAFQVSPTLEVRVPELALMPLGGTEADIIPIPYDRNKNNLTWTDNERFLYFTSPSNGGVILNRLDTRSKKVDRLTDFDSGVGPYAIKGKRLFFAKNEVRNPHELYMADAAATNARRLTSLNHEWVNEKKLSIPEKHTFTNELGLTVEYWIMKPVNYSPGEKYPLLLEIHGGPTAMWGPGERSMWHEYQYFASRGYGIVYSNPRGSGGYGEEFMRANIEDWGAGPASDILRAHDKAVAEGWADTSRLAVTGGSYGGYMVSWILAHDQRFQAACAQRGVYDLTTFFGEGNAWRLIPRYFNGYPWEEEAGPVIERESPYNYVENIHTPLIIFHGEQDLRTGVIQSEMLYKSLKVMGRPVEYVRHPGATHEITRSGDNRQRIDQMLRTYEFFERWFQPQEVP